MELSSVKFDTVSLLSITSERGSLLKHTMNGENSSFAAKTLTQDKKIPPATHPNLKKENDTIFLFLWGRLWLHVHCNLTLWIMERLQGYTTILNCYCQKVC